MQIAINEQFPGANGYLAMHKGKEYTVWTDKGLYSALRLVAEFTKARKESDIIIGLCVKADGTDYIHAAVN